MIKIYCDSVLFDDRNGKVELRADVKGPRENIKYEICTILKYFKTNCPFPYMEAISMMEEENKDVSDSV